MDRFAPITSNQDVLEAIIENKTGQSIVLALITGVNGPSYRPLGAMMAIWPDKSVVGNLSSGCVDNDVIAHGLDCMAKGEAKKLKYGAGSPFFDIQLPCGGGLEISLFPLTDFKLLRAVNDDLRARKSTSLLFDLTAGHLERGKGGETGYQGPRFNIALKPKIRFVVFGKGPETIAFTRLVKSASLGCTIVSPDAETRQNVEQTADKLFDLPSADLPQGLQFDPFTAVLLFFHEHEWEVPIISQLQNHNVFFIGAQGSRKVAAKRLEALRARGLDENFIQSIRGPIGLVPSARDPVTLCVSVFAEVLAVANKIL